MDVLLIILILGVVLLIFYKEMRKLRYWKDLSVPCDKALPVLGNLAPSMFLRKPIAIIHQEMYTKYSKHRYFGYFMFNCPSLMIRDPGLVTQICIKDFHYFNGHREFLPQDIDPFWNRILFAKKDREWQDLRKIVVSAFTLSKIKNMFPVITNYSERLVEDLLERKDKSAIDFNELFLKFSNDFALSSVFGVECNSFQNPKNELYTTAKKAFVLTKVKGLKFFAGAISGLFAKVFGVKIIDDFTKNFYLQVMVESLKNRKTHNIIRQDLLQLLKDEQKKRSEFRNGEDGDGYVPPQISEEDILVQLIGMVLTSTFTFSNYICNIVYELAVNQDVQTKLIKEIDETWANCDKTISYEQLINMKYMDMVCQESLRFRSPTVFMDRVVTKPYTIPPVLPHEKPLHLKPGQDITIPVYCFSRDPQYFKDPEKFDPERFSDENRKNILPQTCLGFGYGLRSCAGYNVALVEAKTILFYILRKFRIVPSERTSIPFPLDKLNISQMNEDGYWLGLKLREDDHRQGF